jgi:hypothetical protein
MTIWVERAREGIRKEESVAAASRSTSHTKINIISVYRAVVYGPTLIEERLLTACAITR